MKKIRENCAGIDIGAKNIFVSIKNGEVRVFETFTSGLREAVEYLITNKVETVAMEATGVYWVILYDMLKEAKLDVWLVDGRQTKQVPGRKTDVKDCQWIQELHSYGLLNRCFLPDAKLKQVRTYQRLREDHLRSSSMHINHMQKALTEMNIRLKEVLSQIHGASGIAIIRAILDGERDPHVLLNLCHGSLKARKADLIIKSLDGFYHESGLFALRQAYEGYQFYQRQIIECDKEQEKLLSAINANDFKDQEREKRKPIRHNKPNIDQLGNHLLKIFDNKDATVLPGITDYGWLQIYGETGSDLSKWPTEKHFTSWLGLAPGQHRSGKMNKSRNRKQHPKAGQIFRQLSQSLIESKQIALGAFGRKIKNKKGAGVAVKATARKLAVLYWKLMVKGLAYTEKGIAAYEERIKLQQERWLQKTAKKLGYQLTVSA